MSKDLNNNEHYLKELADSYRPVPPPAVWDEIEQVLDEDKGKRRSFFIIWTFGVLLVGVAITHLSDNKDIESPIVGQEKIISDYQKQSAPNAKNIGSVDTEAIDQVKQGQTKQRRIKQGQNTNHSEIPETIPPVSKNQEGHKVAAARLASFVNRQQQQQSFKLFNATSESRASKPNTNTNSTKETTIIFDKDRPNPSISTPTTPGDKNVILVTALERLEWMHRAIETSRPLLTLSENLTPIHNYRRKASFSSPWFVELGGGIGRNLSNSVLVDPTQGGFRLNTESKWYSWSASLQLGYQFNNHWYTTLALDLNQTKNKFDFLRSDVSSLIVSDNESFQITNSDFFTIGETSYTFADVGLSIGRRVSVDNWYFSLEGGPIFNALFNANGKVRVGELEFSRLEDQEQYFNTQIGLGARLSAMLDYPISDQLWISVGPSYHQYFITVSSDENPLEERSAIIQVKARVRYHF